MEINPSMMNYWRTLSSEPVKLLDSIIENCKISVEFAALLDSVAQQFEALEDELTAVTKERDNAVEGLEQSEDEIVQLESTIEDLNDRVMCLEGEVTDLRYEVEKLENHNWEDVVGRDG